MNDDHVPPLQWNLGVIEDVHCGYDGLVRVADVRTQSGIFLRAIHKHNPGRAQTLNCFIVDDYCA